MENRVFDFRGNVLRRAIDTVVVVACTCLVLAPTRGPESRDEPWADRKASAGVLRKLGAKLSAQELGDDAVLQVWEDAVEEFGFGCPTEQLTKPHGEYLIGQTGYSVRIGEPGPEGWHVRNNAMDYRSRDSEGHYSVIDKAGAVLSQSKASVLLVGPDRTYAPLSSEEDLSGWSVVVATGRGRLVVVDFASSGLVTVLPVGVVAGP